MLVQEVELQEVSDVALRVLLHAVGSYNTDATGDACGGSCGRGRTATRAAKRWKQCFAAPTEPVFSRTFLESLCGFCDFVALENLRGF